MTTKIKLSTNVADVDLTTTAPTNGQGLIYNSTSSKWVPGAAGGGVTTYDTIDDLPLSGVDEGALALIKSTDKLYLWMNTGWYNIATINTNPSITGGNNTPYTLANDGTPTEITLIASDPEGIPLTWSYEVTSGSLTNGGGTTATVSNVDNVFTVTPTTTEAYAGEFSLTFKASDGVNLGTSVAAFTLAFTSPWDISAASYVQNFSVAAQETTPRGVFFKPDGTVMYVIGQSGQDINQYSLSTAWDVTTASYVQNFSVASQEASPQGVFFKPDGTGMYVTGFDGDYVNQYSLSTAWVVTTASYVRRFSVAAQETVPNGVFFHPDGTVMYVIGYGSSKVNQYSLSTAWNISTASYVQNFSVAAQDGMAMDVSFKSDGTVMYVVGYLGQDVNQYSLSTAWDISTASYVQNFSVAAQDTGPTGVFFKPDGTVMYVIGVAGDKVYQYQL